MPRAPGNREEAIELIRGWATLDHHAESIAALRPSLRLVLDGADESAGSLPLGATRFGGAPDLPVGVRWPTWSASVPRLLGRRTKPVERALTFLAQLRLSEVAHLDPDGPLPREGRLWFFYDLEVQPWGLDEAEADGACVVFEPDETRALVRTARPPVGAATPVLPRAVRPRVEFTLPAYAPFETDATTNGVADDEYDRLRSALAGDLGVDWPIVHRVLGHTDGVQDPPEDCGPGSYRGPAERRAGEPADWLLLLQVDSEDAPGGWCFGDLGRVFFMIHRDDLRERRFDRVWYTLQCT